MTKTDEKLIYDYLGKTNDETYNIMKYLEEAAELQDAMITRKLKPGHIRTPSMQGLIDEIGDLEARLNIIKSMYGVWDKVDERRKYKLKKYEKWIDLGKYTGAI